MCFTCASAHTHRHTKKSIVCFLVHTDHTLVPPMWAMIPFHQLEDIQFNHLPSPPPPKKPPIYCSSISVLTAAHFITFLSEQVKRTGSCCTAICIPGVIKSRCKPVPFIKMRGATCKKFKLAESNLKICGSRRHGGVWDERRMHSRRLMLG